MGNRLDIDRQNDLQPKRMEFAKEQLVRAGYEIIYEDATKIKIMHRGNEITLFPYSGWHTGKGIKDGRGLRNLLSQINNH